MTNDFQQSFMATSTIKIKTSLLFLLTTFLTWNQASAESRVICYYTNWSIYRAETAKFSLENFNPYLCTHLIYAFASPTDDNDIAPSDEYSDITLGGYANFTALKTKNRNLKTLIAIGGWSEGSARFSAIAADPDRRKEFVNNTITFLRKYGFDGLDLDWQHPAFRKGGKPYDKENYVNLVKELKEEYQKESEKTGKQQLLLTMPVPALIPVLDNGYDIPKLIKYLDWMGILSWDYHNGYEPTVNHHSPLYGLEKDLSLNVNYTVHHCLNQINESDKLNLGIPTYGRSYTLLNPNKTDIGSDSEGPGEKGYATRSEGHMAYFEICESLKSDKEWVVRAPNPNAMGPYAYKGNQWVGYDDEDMVKRKAQFAANKKLGGIMFWNLDFDDFRGDCSGKPYPLIEAAKKAFAMAEESVSASFFPR